MQWNKKQKNKKAGISILAFVIILLFQLYRILGILYKHWLF